MQPETAVGNAVETRIAGSVVVLTLNRPEKRNAINAAVLLGIADALELIRGDPALRVLILTGAGGNFSAGADLSQWGDATTPASRLQNHRIWEVFDELERLDRPVIAAIPGFALGGGCELAMCCDLRIASEDAQFGQPEIKVGIIPGGGATHRLTRLVGLSKAKEMILLGERVPAQEALRIGLVNRVVTKEQLLPEAMAWAERLAALPPVALVLAKQVMNQTLSVDTGTALYMEQLACSVLFSTEDQKEGMRAFGEKRRPEFRGR